VQVPPLALVIDAGADTVSGTCYPDQRWSAETADLLAPDWDRAGADGTFTADLFGLDPGEEVIVLCEDARGDRLENRQLAP
jgi:hypothetical protein